MSGNDEQEIVRLANLILRATEQADADALRQIIADEYVITGSGGVWGTHGKFGNKASTVARWGSSQPIETGNSTLSEQKITISGDTALMVSLITDRWADQEGEHVLCSWVSDVWVKREGNWRLFASHESIFQT